MFLNLSNVCITMNQEQIKQNKAEDIISFKRKEYLIKLRITDFKKGSPIKEEEGDCGDDCGSWNRGEDKDDEVL